MPTTIELRAEQKDKLYNLLLIKHELGSTVSKELNRYIYNTIAEMEAEDVAYVQKIIEELKP